MGRSEKSGVVKLPVKEKFKLSIEYGDDLLERPIDGSSMASYCDECMQWLEQELGKSESEQNIHQVVTVLGEVAAYFKTLRKLDDALDLIETSLALIEQYDMSEKKFVVHSLRWADILRYRAEFGDAEKILEDTLDLCERVKDLHEYQDFALQHLGKLNFDLEEYDLALEYFEKALALRKTKNNSELIDSTEFAIKTTRKIIQSGKSKF